MIAREGGNQIDGELHMLAGESRAAACEQAPCNVKCHQGLLERLRGRQTPDVVMWGDREVVGCHYDDRPATLAFASSSLRLPLRPALSMPHRHLRVRLG